MKRTTVTVKETELRERLYPLISGRVFHVTRLENVVQIVCSGGIAPNVDGALASTFGSSGNSYFKNRGCVSVFDLVHPSVAEIEEYLPRCWPFQTARPGEGIAVFFLSPKVHDGLLSWHGWREEQALSEMVVPFVEAGYQGMLPLSAIEEIIEVLVEEVPDSIQAMHRRLAAERENPNAV